MQSTLDNTIENIKPIIAQNISKEYNHKIVNYGIDEYVNQDSYTNTIEGFWGLFKRAIVGCYHKLSRKHLYGYIQECCFKYNNKGCDIFGLFVRNAVC